MPQIRKNALAFLVCILLMLLAFPVYAAQWELLDEGDPSTGREAIYIDVETGCTSHSDPAKVFYWNYDAGMDAGSSSGGSSEESGGHSEDQIAVATVSGSVPSSYTSTKERIGEPQTITRSDGTSGTRDTYDIDGDKTEIVTTFDDGTETTTTFNSDGTKITTTDGKAWSEWFRTGDDSSDSMRPDSLPDEPVGKGKGETTTELYEFTHDNITGELTAVGTVKDKSGREIDMKIVIVGEDPIPDPKPDPSDGSAEKKTDGTDGKDVKKEFTESRTTTDVTSGREGETPYKDLQTFTEEITKIEGGRTVTTETPGKVTITQDFEDGTTKTFTVTGDGTVDYDYTITKEDGTTSTHHMHSSFSHDTEERTEFVGYDWVIENLTDPYSPFYMSPTSFTTPGMTERQYEDGPIDHGGLLPVGEGYIRKDGREYWFVNYGDHTATVTPWWNVDVYEVWEETSTDTDEFGNTKDTTEHFEEYRYSYKTSRAPRVFEFTIPLVCLDCPVPADGYRVCVGGGCDCIGYSDELMTVCDDEHTVELDIENRVELEQ